MIKYTVKISDTKKQDVFKLFSMHRLGQQDEIVHNGVRYYIVRSGGLTVETLEPPMNVDGAKGYGHQLVRGELIVLENPNKNIL